MIDIVTAVIFRKALDSVAIGREGSYTHAEHLLKALVRGDPTKDKLEREIKRYLGDYGKFVLKEEHPQEYTKYAKGLVTKFYPYLKDYDVEGS